MSYKVLYRKYRPDSFDNLIGQNATIKILKNSIINDKISHAYIFSGPRGTGKTSTARILAKTINCLDNKNGVACGKCENCLNFATSPDIIEIDAASNNGVEEIRELINNVKLMPTSSKYKVYIIDEVHMLSTSAFNALLLTLEEPPKHVVFILATTNIESVPITIISRCQKYEFAKISEDLIVKHLIDICDKEKIKYTEDGIKEIAILSDGGLRDALSIIDQLSKENVEITPELVAESIGTVSDQFIKNIIKYIEDNDVKNIVGCLKKLSDTNVNYKNFIKKLVKFLAIYSVEILENGEKNISFSIIKNLIIELNDSINKMNINVNPYIIIQTIILSYIKIDSKNDTHEIQEVNIPDIEQIKEELKIKKEEKNSSNIKDIIAIRINNCFVNASKKYLEIEKNNWQKFVDNDCKSIIKGLILDTEVVAASDKYIIITCSIKHKEKEINNKLSEIEDNYNDIYNSDKRLAFLSEIDWKKAKEEYIKRINNNEKYSIINEEKIESDESDEMINIANDLFDKDKLEIK